MSEPPDHAVRNRELWDSEAANWVGSGERSWNQDPSWGIWETPMRTVARKEALDSDVSVRYRSMLVAERICR